MNVNKKIIAIIPALNEEGKIGLVVSRIKRESPVTIDEILVVDDGSRDNTRREAQDNGALVLSHDGKKGVGSAIRTGIDYALSKKYDLAIVLGGDNQDDPGEINRLISPIVFDNFDFVQGSRYMAGGRIVNIPVFRRITTKIYAVIFRLFSGFSISDGTNGFRAFKLSVFNNKCVNIWQSWLNHYELEPYLFYKVIQCNFRVTEVPVTKSYPKGNIGYTKMIPILGWWSILRPMILLKLGIKK